MQQRINIVGAGVAGLSLATYLRVRNIPYHIFDAASKPEGHNYGVTLTTDIYEHLASRLDPKLDRHQFNKAIAVDRLINRNGQVLSSDASVPAGSNLRKRVRAQDSALRTLLTQNHPISWSHRLKSAQQTAAGLQLSFENGKTATAAITVDASGERQALTSCVAQESEPEVLPYAVYHGSRYIAVSEYDAKYGDLFEGTANVRELTFPTTASSVSEPFISETTGTTLSPRTYVQLSRAFVPFSGLPSSIQQRNLGGDSDLYVEIRYTVSRAARTNHPQENSNNENDTKQDHQQINKNQEPDPLFKPNRSKQEASQIPPEFYTEVASLLTETKTTPQQDQSPEESPTTSQPEENLPQGLFDLFDPQALKTDRILNWHLRIRHPRTPNLEAENKKKDSHPHDDHPANNTTNSTGTFTDNTTKTLRDNTNKSTNTNNNNNNKNRNKNNHDEKLQKLASSHNIIVIGDAAHSLPILGSHGADLAMEDARTLADWLDHNDENEKKDLADFYTDTKRPEVWAEAEREWRVWLTRVHSIMV